jgi:hypothetical protein
VHLIQLAIVASEINLKSDASARVCRIEFSVHTAAAPREIVQRFERGARAGVMIDQRAERALGRRYR